MSWLHQIGDFLNQYLLKMHAGTWNYFPRLDWNTSINTFTAAPRAAGVDGLYLFSQGTQSHVPTGWPGVFYFVQSDVNRVIPYEGNITGVGNYLDSQRSLSWVMNEPLVLNKSDNTFWAFTVDPVDFLSTTAVQMLDLLVFLGKFMIDFFEIPLTV